MYNLFTLTPALNTSIFNLYYKFIVAGKCIKKNVTLIILINNIQYINHIVNDK